MKSYKEKVNENNRLNPNKLLLNHEQLSRLQETLLEIYLDVQTVCQKNGLVCMLLGGSALGSVRHKGFIPWDDDLDMGMPRKDYEKFKKIFKKELGDKYTLNGPNYEGNSTNRFPKILKNGTKFVEIGMEDDERACIKIDIFILDNVPDNIIKRYCKGIYCTFLMFAGSHVYSYEVWKRVSLMTRVKITTREFIGKLFSFNSADIWFNCIDNACSYVNEKSKYVGIPTGRKHYFGEILKREVYLPVTEGVFAGRRVFLPANTDVYLTNLYGDYMQIPPEDKREHHYVEKISF